MVLIQVLKMIYSLVRPNRFQLDLTLSIQYVYELFYLSLRRLSLKRVQI